MWINKIFPNNLQLSPFHLPIFLFVFFPWNWHTHKPNTIWNPFMGHTAIPDDKQAEVWACYASATFPNEKFLRIGRLLASRCWKKRNPTEGKHAFLGVRIDVFFFFFRKSPFSSTFYVYIWCDGDRSKLSFGGSKGSGGLVHVTYPPRNHPPSNFLWQRWYFSRGSSLKKLGFSVISIVWFYIYIIYIYISIYICCLGIFGDPWIKHQVII